LRELDKPTKIRRLEKGRRRRRLNEVVGGKWRGGKVLEKSGVRAVNARRVEDKEGERQGDYLFFNTSHSKSEV
jgi:hypothetical protein